MLEVTYNYSQGKINVHLRGELGIETTPYFAEKMQQVQTYPAKEVVIDLEGLEFIDSTGVRALLDALKLVGGEGRQFSVVNIKEQVYNILELIGLVQMFGTDKFRIK